jgi:hypothetical protein
MYRTRLHQQHTGGRRSRILPPADTEGTVLGIESLITNTVEYNIPDDTTGSTNPKIDEASQRAI